MTLWAEQVEKNKMKKMNKKKKKKKKDKKMFTLTFSVYQANKHFG